MENERQHAFADYADILGTLSYAVIMLGIIMLIPLLILPFYPEEMNQMQCFIVPGVLSIFAGYIVRMLVGEKKKLILKRNGGSLTVLSIWIVSILIGSIPFVMTGEYSFTQAVFEATSGFTTTGFTVTNVETASHLILLYRSVLHLFGGVGLILILSSVLSDIYGMQLFDAEGHTDRITPSLLHSARTIVYIYLGFIIGGSTLYIIFGMDPFDAINHSISAVATGGFSTKVDSLGYWHSVPIDIVTIVLMILGSTNFGASLLLLRGKFKDFFSHSETRITVFLIAIVTPIVIAELLVQNICPNMLSAIDNGLFQVVSILTTTGLSTINNFIPRASFAYVPLILLAIVGGSSGSTAGGIKACRAALASRSIFYDIREHILPRRVVCLKQINRFGKYETITDRQERQNFTYLTIYMIIGFLGTFGLMVCGYNFQDSFFEFFSALGTVGMSIGVVSPTMSTGAMWIIIVGMLIARLEVYIILLAIARMTLDAKEFFSKFRRKFRREK